MRAETQMKILQLCKGKTIGQAMNRLEIMEKHIAQKILEKRIAIGA